MNISYHLNENVLGVTMHYKLYQPVVPSDNYFIMCHGRGECAVGTPSNSKLDMVEAHGYPKMARMGYEFPFNIIAAQVYHPTSQGSATYGSFSKYFPYWIKAKFGARKMVWSGLSLGGQYTDNIATNPYHRGIIDAFVSVCGKPDNPRTIDPNLMADIPSISVHGDKDTTVVFADKKIFVDRVNALPDRLNKINFIILPGVGHNCWDWAYSPNNDVWNFIHGILKNPEAAQSLEEFKTKAKTAIDLIS
jgi:hypothetical protein